MELIIEPNNAISHYSGSCDNDIDCHRCHTTCSKRMTECYLGDGECYLESVKLPEGFGDFDFKDFLRKERLRLLLETNGKPKTRRRTKMKRSLNKEVSKWN